jgi:hypothetical protein
MLPLLAVNRSGTNRLQTASGTVCQALRTKRNSKWLRTEIVGALVKSGARGGASGDFTKLRVKFNLALQKLLYFTYGRASTFFK